MVWRRVFVHEAQTKGVREEDIVAVYGRFDWWTEPPAADGQRVWSSEVQDCPAGGDFLGTSGAHQRVRRARAPGGMHAVGRDMHKLIVKSLLST